MGSVKEQILSEGFRRIGPVDSSKSKVVYTLTEGGFSEWTVCNRGMCVRLIGTLIEDTEQVVS